MNNPNPFVPKGSLLEQQSKRRAGLKLGVFCVLAIGVTSLAAMLIQGCKREESGQNADNGTPMVDTNNYAADTNVPSVEASNPPVAAVPQAPVPATPPSVTPPPVTPVPTAQTENEYVVVKGDTLGKIAKANGVTVKAIEDANPGVQPARLKVGQKLMLPAGVGTTGASAAQETANGVATSTGGGQAYTVKSGDTLSHIAKHFGVTLKALMAENNLTTTHIRVGQKLNIPAKAEISPAPVNAPPASAPEPQPVTPAPQTPPSSEAPAPQSPAPSQQSMR